MPARPALPLLHPSVFLLGTWELEGGVVFYGGRVRKRGERDRCSEIYVGVFGDGSGVGGEREGEGGTERWDGKGGNGEKGWEGMGRDGKGWEGVGVDINFPLDWYTRVTRVTAKRADDGRDQQNPD